MSDVGRKRVVVLGAGMTGLSAAYRLSPNREFEVHVIDKEADAGGVCRSFTEGKFILDHGPHKFYSLVEGVTEEMCRIMGDDFLVRDKKQSLYMNDRYFTFPLRMGEMLTRFPLAKSTKILLSYIAQVAQVHKEPNTYEEFIVQRFGRGLYGQIFEPMARKIFGPPDTLDRKLAEVRISSPGLLSVVKQILFPSKIDRTLSAPTFHYPKYGYGMIPKRLEEMSRANGVQFHLGSKLVSMELSGGKISEVVFESENGGIEKLSCENVIYTIPLSHLEHLLDLSPEARRACRFVNYRHAVIYYFLLRSEPILPSMWVFFPEEKFRFGRLSEMVKFSPHTAPPGHTALMADFTCQDDDAEWSMGERELGALLLGQLESLHLFKREQILKSFSRRFRNFYPIYSVGFQENLNTLRHLESSFGNLFLVGRLGDFNYNNADQCLDMGYRVADHLIGAKPQTQWRETRKHFDRYKIVD